MSAYPIGLSGKVALVTGGLGGIGQVALKQLAGAGARCVVNYRGGEDKADAAAALIESLPGQGHLAFAAELTDSPALARMAAEIEARCGRLDILVNTGGYTKPVPLADLDGLTDDLIDDMFKVNWRGQFATVRATAPLLKASGDGLIVFVSSIAGLNGNGSSAAYAAVKAATDSLVKSLARALAPEVRVLGVSPGVVDTQFVAGRTAEFNAKIGATIPLRRVATPDDVAAAITACATMLGYSTGSTIVVDGGRLL